MMEYIVALDQGTTSTRALAFGLDGQVLKTFQKEFQQHYPQSGWVEHDAAEIWSTSLGVLSALELYMQGKNASPIAMGITNQRETTIVWEKESGNPIGHAIVWQDRRTADFCKGLKQAGHSNFIRAQTGLQLDPYFSASKIAWLLDHHSLRGRSDIVCGTIDSYLTYRLTAGAAHVTDATNASRTSLLPLQSADWSDDLCDLFAVPKSILPKIIDTAGPVGEVAKGLPFAGVPITALVGDQQSAAIGQACLNEGQIKSTYGTGCFLIAPTGEQPIISRHQLLSTVAYQLGGKRCYALEGSIFNAGTVIQWLRDMLGVIASSEESEALAQSVPSSEGLYFVPAFTGLGAPYWDPDARGTITGIERSHTRAHIVRAGLEGIIFQTVDLLNAIQADTGVPFKVMKIDGGMAKNNWFAEQLSMFSASDVLVPKNVETTAFGAAFMAGLGAGIYQDITDVADLWQADKQFNRAIDSGCIRAKMQEWHQAVKKCLSSA